MLSRLGAVLIVGLGALALRVNGEAAECASVLEVGNFRRPGGESAVVKRCEENVASGTAATTTTTTTTTIPVICAETFLSCTFYFNAASSEWDYKPMTDAELPEFYCVLQDSLGFYDCVFTADTCDGQPKSMFGEVSGEEYELCPTQSPDQSPDDNDAASGN